MEASPARPDQQIYVDFILVLSHYFWALFIVMGTFSLCFSQLGQPKTCGLVLRVHQIYLTFRDECFQLDILFLLWGKMGGHVVPPSGSISSPSYCVLCVSIAQHLYIILGAAVHLSVHRISLPSLSPMTSKSSLLLL